MAKKKRSADRSPSPATDGTPSLFDRDNLEHLDALRYEILRASAAPPASVSTKLTAEQFSDAARLFGQNKIDDDDETWNMGELNVKIIHRGRIRISRTQWQQVITTCSAAIREEGIRKDVHLNILQHPSSVRLIYISYRYKQSGEKQKECRRGLLVDQQTNIEDLMERFAYWFTAQPHAEANYDVWSELVDEAMTKLRNAEK